MLIRSMKLYNVAGRKNENPNLRRALARFLGSGAA